MTTLDNLIRSARRRLRKALDRSCAEHHEAVALEFQRLRRTRGLPPYLVQAGGWLQLPKRFECPECGARVFIEVDAYGADTGIPSAGGISVSCQREEAELDASMQQDREPAWQHQHFQGTWAPLVRQVERWCARNVRVPVERKEAADA